MKYKIKDRNEIFIREDEGVSIVLLKQKHDQFILNETGVVMFKLILDNFDTDLVLNSLQKKYDEIDIEILRNDMENIIRMLKIYNIIIFEDEIYNVIPSTQNITTVDENDYERIEFFIRNNRCDDMFISGTDYYYNAVNIRAHIINNQEYYFCKKDENGEIVGVIVINPNLNNSVINITALIINKEKTDDEKCSISKELIEYASKSMINKVNKIRISFYSLHDEKIKFLKIYLSIGFKIEAELKEEYLNKSLYLYSLLNDKL